MVKGNLAIGLPSSSKIEHKCSCCVAGKRARAPFPKATEFRASKPLELVYADICGIPITPSIVSGGNYFLLIVDDFSRVIWVAILKNKSKAFGAFKKFKTLAESDSNGALIKCLRTDRGGEFTSEEFSKWCEEKGIQRQLTTPYTPQQNGVVERKNRTVVGLIRSMLKDKSLPLELWGEAINTCVYVLNRSSMKSLQGKTPYEMWSEKKPKLSHLRIFGSIVHVKTPGALGKLEDMSKEMVFVGYERGTKGYQCFNPTTHKVHLSRDVIFDEGRKWKFME